MTAPSKSPMNWHRPVVSVVVGSRFVPVTCPAADWIVNVAEKAVIGRGPKKSTLGSAIDAYWTAPSSRNEPAYGPVATPVAVKTAELVATQSVAADPFTNAQLLPVVAASHVSRSPF